MSNTSLVHTVKLRLFQDEANGEYGLAHDKTYIESKGGDGFNAFWDGRGIFHVVFEHWFELEHPYFQGRSAMNVGGEMAAMGALWYYYDTLGVRNRQQPGSIHYFGDSMRHTTEDMVTETLSEGSCNFGDTLESSVPNQKESNNSELECQLDLYWQNILKHKPSKWSMVLEEERSKEYALHYRKSLTKRKIQNLHRWGYSMAQDLIPHNNDNRVVLSEFITFWDDFCKRNKAEELAASGNYIEIRIYKDDDDRISWKGFFLGNYEVGEIEIHKHFSLDDIYAATAENEE